MTDKPVWDKPRPKGLGKPSKLSSSQKASAKAAAKAAGRPWPNLVDNMRAARKARAFGGEAYTANSAVAGMDQGGVPGMMPQGANPNLPNAGNIPSAAPTPTTPPPQLAQQPVPNMPMNMMSGANPAGGYAKGGAVDNALRVAKLRLAKGGKAELNVERSPSHLNFQYAKPGPYRTELGIEEPVFRQWVEKNNVPFNPDEAHPDYDMRGYYKALVTGDPGAQTSINLNDHAPHYPDTYKTPIHESFSSESKYATEDAPKWNEDDQLVDRSGAVVFDEKAKHRAEGGELEEENPTEKTEDNTSVAQKDDASREQFLHKELEGSAPQYNPSYDKAIKAAFQYTPPGAAMDAAGYLGNPSIKQNIQSGRYIPAAMQAAAVAMPLGFAGRKAATTGLKAGAEQLYKLGKPDVVGMPGYTAYKTVEDWAPSVVGQQAWNAAKDYGAQAVDALRQATGYAEGGRINKTDGGKFDPNAIQQYLDSQKPKSQRQTPSSPATGATTPKTSRPIAPEEYQKGNLKGGEYVMAKGGKVHPDVDKALRLANREHFRRGGMGYTLPPGVANNAKAMQQYINSNMDKMTDLQRLEALQIAEAGNQKTDQSRALPVLNVMNRAAAGFNEGGAGRMSPEQQTTIRGQIMAPRQFTSMTGQTPKNLQVGVNAINNVLHNSNNPQVRQADDLVHRVAKGDIEDFTKGSMYYATPGGAGRQFVQQLHHDKNVGDFGQAGAHVYAGNKVLSPVAKVNYPNVRDDLQRELASNREVMAADRTPQAAASQTTPQAAASQTTPDTTPASKAVETVTPQVQQIASPQAPEPVKAPDEASTQNFLKAQMANTPEPAQAQPAQPPIAPTNAPQPEGKFGVDFQESKAPEPTQMAGAEEEPIAKPMNPQGPEAPEASAVQAEAPKMEAPEPVVQQDQPEAPEIQAQAAETPEDNTPFTFDFDQAANGGAIKNKKTIDRGLEIARKYAKDGGVYGQDGKLRLHQRVARHGYATDGAVKDAPEFDESGSVMAKGYGEDVPQKTAHDFVRQQLSTGEPQEKQYNPEGGVETAKEAGRMAATMTTPGAIADAAGMLGAPSIKENIGKGKYLDAALQAAGAVPVVGPLAKGAGAAHLAMSMMPKARAVEDALKIAKKVPNSPQEQLLYNLKKQRPDALKRARQMGFNTNEIVFHGTDQPIEGFYPNVYVAKDPSIAEVYARKREYEPVQYDLFKPNPAPNIIPMFVKKGSLETTNPLAQYYKVFDPRHMRSIFADFNPEYSESTDLLKSDGGSVDDDLH